MVDVSSADGSGPQCISQAIIIREMMYRIQDTLKLSDPPRPCDYFDIMGGVSSDIVIDGLAEEVPAKRISQQMYPHQVADQAAGMAND